MELNIQQSVQKLKRLHPDLKPKWWIEDQGVFLICLLPKNQPEDKAIVQLYAVDPKKGTTAGPIPTMTIYGNDKLQKKLANPNTVFEVPTDDKPVQHSARQVHGYRIRKELTDYPDYLAHYGIKGQKWGVRRFQYENGAYTAEGKERYRGTGAKAAGSPVPQAPEKMTFMEKHRTRTARIADSYMDAMMRQLPHDREKSKKGDHNRVIVDVAYTVLNPANAIHLAADGVGAAIAKSKLNKYMKNRDNKSEPDPTTGLPKKKEGAYTDKEDLAAVNPGFMNTNSNTKNNCMLCTTTYDMRKRGYDVTAQLDSEGYNFQDLKRWYPKAKIERTSRYDERGVGVDQKEYMKRTVDNLLKQGNGARGNLMVVWNQGGAHSLFYEVQNGSVIIRDGQANQVYTNPEKILRMTMGSSYARLDNVKPNWEQIKKECVR